MRNNIHTITTMKETLSIRFIRRWSLIYVQVLRLKKQNIYTEILLLSLLTIKKCILSALNGQLSETIKTVLFEFNILYQMLHIYLYAILWCTCRKNVISCCVFEFNNCVVLFRNKINRTFIVSRNHVCITLFKAKIIHLLHKQL